VGCLQSPHAGRATSRCSAWCHTPKESHHDLALPARNDSNRRACSLPIAPSANASPKGSFQFQHIPKMFFPAENCSPVERLAGLVGIEIPGKSKVRALNFPIPV
jgi:hypothetical protein